MKRYGMRITQSPSMKYSDVLYRAKTELSDVLASELIEGKDTDGYSLFKFEIIETKEPTYSFGTKKYMAILTIGDILIEDTPYMIIPHCMPPIENRYFGALTNEITTPYKAWRVLMHTLRLSMYNKKHKAKRAFCNSIYEKWYFSKRNKFKVRVSISLLFVMVAISLLGGFLW